MKANKNKVFISAPNSLNWSTIMNFAQTVINKGADVYFWDRESKYGQKEFDSCDTVVFLLPNNKFEAGHKELPIGLRNELQRAYAQSKQILLGYKTSNGSYNFYDTNTNGQYIQGISGTACALDRIVERTKKEIAKSAMNIAQNSTYGIFVPNPCDEVKLPKGIIGSVGHKGTPGVAGIEFDERLLLML